LNNFVDGQFVRIDQLADLSFELPSWKVNSKFNEMLIELGLAKYQQSLNLRISIKHL